MGAKSEKAAVRLAQQQNVGAVLFNCYQWLTQLGSLYGDAVANELEEARQQRWNEVFESSLEDLSILSHVWNTLIANHPQVAKDVVHSRASIVLRNSARLQKVYPMFNEWLPMHRWARFLHRVENLLGSVLAAVELPEPLGAQCLKLSDSSAWRLSHLAALLDEYDQMNADLNVGVDRAEEGM